MTPEMSPVHQHTSPPTPERARSPLLSSSGAPSAIALPPPLPPARSPPGAPGTPGRRGGGARVRPRPRLRAEVAEGGLGAGHGAGPAPAAGRDAAERGVRVAAGSAPGAWGARRAADPAAGGAGRCILRAGGRGCGRGGAAGAMDSVVALVNRLQSAATLLGDHAGGDKNLPSLWDMLPSIVVIGGQVPPPNPLREDLGPGWTGVLSPTQCPCGMAGVRAAVGAVCEADSWCRCSNRAPGRAPCWRQSWGRTSCHGEPALSRGGRWCCSSCGSTTQGRVNTESSSITTERRYTALVRGQAALEAMPEQQLRNLSAALAVWQLTPRTLSCRCNPARDRGRDSTLPESEGQACVRRPNPVDCVLAKRTESDARGHAWCAAAHAFLC